MPLNRRAAAKNKLKTWLADLSITGQFETAQSRLRSPFQSSGKKSLFEQGTALVSSATRRIALVAKTPIPLVGTRPYGQPVHAIDYEREQFKTYMSLAERASSVADLEFRCIASKPSLLTELFDHGDLLYPLVEQNLGQLATFASAPGSRFDLRWCDHSTLPTFVVADDHFMIWMKDKGGESVWITAENPAIARALWDQAEVLSVSHQLGENLTDLGMRFD